MASQVFSKINKSVSLVMLHTFMDFCLEKFNYQQNPEIKDYLQNLAEKCGDFPEDGAQETRNLADDMFSRLTIQFQTGDITKDMPQQYLLCSLLYSVLEGAEAIERQNSCLYASLKIHEIQRTGQSRPHNTQPTKQPQREPAKVEKTNSKLKLKMPEKRPYVYNRDTAIQYLAKQGIQLPTNVKYPEDFEDIILRDISHGANCLEVGDKERALKFFKKARKAWQKHV